MIDKSKVVIGTLPLSGSYGLVSLSTIQTTLEHCYEVGFKEFDTAPSYGDGFMESCLGRIFYGKEDVLIDTKIGGMPFKVKSFNIEDLQKSFSQSLKRLYRDSVNILFLHNPRDEVKDYQTIINFMDELKSKNKIMYKGLSLARNYDYSNKLDLSAFDVIQDDANLLSMRFLEIKLPSKVQFMARSPLASGILSGNITLSSTFPPEDHRSEWLKGERLQSILKRVEVIKKASDIGLPSLARRFLFKHSNIDKIIFGIKQSGSVDDIIEDLNSPPLDSDIEQKLIQLYENDFGLINEGHLGY